MHIRWHDRGIPNLTQGRLVDIGSGGVLVMANAAVEVGKQVSLSLADGTQHELIEATVVGVDEVVGLSLERWKAYKVRLAFRDPCPDEFMKVTVDDFLPSLRSRT